MLGKKLYKPSWWNAQGRRVFDIFAFWGHYWATRPFPDNYTSVDDLVHFGKHNRVLGFNHEAIRAYIFWKLHQKFGCTSFVETGTLWGHTAGFVRRVFNTPVYTSEIYSTYYLVSRANLVWANKVNIFRSDSRDFLASICHQATIGGNPMFYLDAHWYDYLPLPDELVHIGENCRQAVIVIDDFYVPSDPRFNYDEYPGVRIDLEVLQKTLLRHRDDVTIYLPCYNPQDEPYGKATGFAVALMGQKQELPNDLFPFNLLARVCQ